MKIEPIEKSGTIFTHTKSGNRYKLLGEVVDEATGDASHVAYQSLQDGVIYHRSRSEFKNKFVRCDDEELQELAKVRLGVMTEQRARLQQVADAYRTGSKGDIYQAAKSISELYPPMQKVKE